MGVRIKNYNDAKAIFSTCRFHISGKPLRNWCRLFKVDDSYVIKSGYIDIAIINPDDTITFLMSGEELCDNKYTLVAGVRKLLGIFIARISVGKYRIATREMVPLDKNPWRWMCTSAPSYFQGIQFSLASKLCLNKRPDMETVVDKDINRAWRADLRHAKKVLYAMARVGALSKLRDDIRARDPNVLDWNHGYMIPEEQVFSASGIVKTAAILKAREYPPEWVAAFAFYHEDSYRRHYGKNDEDLGELDQYTHRIDAIFGRASKFLRKEYGVFIGERPKKDKEL